MSTEAAQEHANNGKPPHSISTSLLMAPKIASPMTPQPTTVTHSGATPDVVPPPAFARLFARRGHKKLHHYSACASTVADLRPCALTSSSSSAGNFACSGGTGGGDGLCGSSRARVRGRQCDPPTRILDFLYLGSVQDAQDAAFLRAHNIQYIINVSEEEYWSVDKRIIVFPFKASDMDNFDISRFFRPTRQILDHVCRLYFKPARRSSTHGLPSTNTSSGPCVLVHCQRGRSRSATIVLAYLVYRNGWSVAEALRYVRSRRPSVEPNLGFLEALRILQESMSVAERNAKCGRQSVVVKNVSCTTPAAVVQAFFETHVGMVRDVLIHHGVDGDRGECSSVVLSPDSRLRDDEGGGDVSGVTKDKAQRMEGEIKGTTATLCIVSFACAESVQRAKTFAAQHSTELQQLCAAAGKMVKVLLPAKIMASSTTTGCTVHGSATTTCHVAASPFRSAAVVDRAGRTRLANSQLSRHVPSAQHRRRAESMRLRSASMREGQQGVTPPRALTTCSIPEV